MEDFVTFNLAKKLKEKGFDYPCIGHYFNNQLYIAHYQNAFHSDKNETFDAPTISQVLKWLRKEKSIHVELILWTNGWYYEVWCFEYNENDKEYDTKIEEQSMDYSSYELAAMAGIEYVFDNLI